MPRPLSGGTTVPSMNDTGKIAYPHAKVNLDAYLTLSIKINSKWMKELNTKAETIKFLEENFITLDFSNAFLNITPKAQIINLKIHK